MKYIIPIILLYIYVPAYGQGKRIHIFIHENGDTTSRYSYHKYNVKKAVLESLEKSPYKYHFRLWNGNEAITIWVNKDNTYQGDLTLVAYEYVDRRKENETNRIYKETTPLTDSQINKILSLIESSGIFAIPHEDSFNIVEPIWVGVIHGVNIVIEHSDEANYHFKSYNTPGAYADRIPEAKTIHSFVDSCFKITAVDSIWTEFKRKIPFEQRIRGIVITTIIGTKQEKRQYRRERNKYRKSIGIKNKPEREKN